MPSPLTTENADNGYRIYWRGHYLGLLRYCGSGFLWGQLSYRGDVFDTDVYGGCGIPQHWVREKIADWCAELDAKSLTKKHAA